MAPCIIKQERTDHQQASIDEFIKDYEQKCSLYPGWKPEEPYEGQDKYAKDSDDDLAAVIDELQLEEIL